MKLKSKKLLLILGIASAMSFSALAIACSSTATTSSSNGVFGVSDNISQGVWTTITKKPLNTSPWSFDRTIQIGQIAEGTDAMASNATQAQFVRTETEGEPKFTLDSNGSPIYNAWTYESFKFDYAAAILLTPKDGGAVQTFDNDKAEIREPGQANSPVTKAFSADPKSINSQAFRDALKNAKRLQIRIRDGFFYSDYQGNKTSYEIKAEDFWASYKRTNLLTKTLRQASGGSEALDKKAIALSPVNNLFSNSSSYRNGYLYSLFGVDLSRLLDEKTALLPDPENDQKKLITWDGFEGGSSFNFLGVFEVQLSDTTQFSPVSQEYIAKLNQEAKFNDFDSATGDAKRFGVYTYGRDWQELLYPGYFYISDVDQTNNTIRYRFNNSNVHALENKAKAGYVKSVDEVSIQDQIDNRLVNEFKLGKIYDVPTRGSLGQSQRTELDEFLKSQNDRRFALSFARSKLIQGGFVLTHPSPQNGTNESGDDYLFNDNLAKLIYGKTRSQIAAGKDVQTDFFSAKSIAFRNALFAGVNWLQWARGLNDTFTPYLGHTAPDALINGSDQTSSKIKKTRDAIDFLNVRRVLHYDPTTQEISGFDQDKTSNDKDNLEIINKNINQSAEQYKSNAFVAAQKEVTAILDAEKIPNDQKVTWIWVAPDRAKSNEQEAEAVKNLVNTLNSLDTKGRLDIQYQVIEDQSKNDASIKNGIGYTISGKWTNDYEGIGTAIDGISHRERATMLPFFSRAFNPGPKDAWIAKIYPQITKMSQKLDAFIKNLNVDTTQPQTRAYLVDPSRMIPELSTWKDLPNIDWASDELTQKAINVHQFALLGAFFTSYQTSHTNQELLNLNKEITEVIGFIPGRKQGASLLPSQKPVLQAVNKGRILPVPSSGTLYIEDIALAKREN